MDHPTVPGVQVKQDSTTSTPEDMEKNKSRSGLYRRSDYLQRPRLTGAGSSRETATGRAEHLLFLSHA